MAFSAPQVKQPLIMCEACNKDNVAISRCLTCDDFICSNCLRMHKRWAILKFHRIQKLAQYGSAQTVETREVKNGVAKCSVHLENITSCYCDTCEQLMCHTCSVSYHKSSIHSIIGLRKAKMKLKECIVGLAPKVRAVAVELDKDVVVLQQCCEKLQIRYEDIKSEISERACIEAARVQEEAGKIEEEAVNLVQELEQIYGERVEALKMAKTGLRKTAHRARSMLDEVKRPESMRDCQMVLALKQKLTKLAANQRADSLLHDGEFFVTFVGSESRGSVGRLVLEDEPKLQPFCRIKSTKTTKCGHSPREFVDFRFMWTQKCQDTSALPFESSSSNRERQCQNASLEVKKDKQDLQSNADRLKCREQLTVTAVKQCQKASNQDSFGSCEFRKSEACGSVGRLVLQDAPRLQTAEHKDDSLQEFGEFRTTTLSRCQDTSVLPFGMQYCKGEREVKNAISELRLKPIEEGSWVLKTEFKNFGPDQTDFALSTYVATFRDSETVVVDLMQTELISFFPQSEAVPQRLQLPDLSKASNAAGNKNYLLVILHNQSVKVFDRQCQFLYEFIPMTGRDSTRSCLAIDDDNVIAVGYKYKKEVSLHTLNGSQIKTLSAPMIGDYLSTSNQRIIYTNYERKKLLGISYDGDLLFSVDITSDAEMHCGPTGVCCDGEGSIYVAVDKGKTGGEIRRYSPDAVYLGCIVADCGLPRGMAYTPHGELVVATKHAVQIYHRTHGGEVDITNQSLISLLC